MNEGAELQELSELSGGLVYVQGHTCTTGDGFGRQRSRRLWTGSREYGVQHISNITAMETRRADLQRSTLEPGSYQDKFVPVWFEGIQSGLKKISQWTAWVDWVQRAFSLGMTIRCATVFYDGDKQRTHQH